MTTSYNLWQEICDRENFATAWKRVRANMGAPGVDRVSIQDFEAGLTDNLALLRELLQQGAYQPVPMISFAVAKTGGGSRTLHIPAVRDRVVQEAALLILQPMLDKTFLNCCYGYRPKMSAAMAVKRVERNVSKGKEWIVDADIEHFFDTVSHDLLLQFLSMLVPENRILDLIRAWIAFQPEGKGIPQGAVISPLLANVYLHRFDQRMIRGQGHYVRYCDDFVVLCKSREEAEDALDVAGRCLTQDLHLTLKVEKTRICRLADGFVFLGFHFDSRGKRPCQQAVAKLEEKIDRQLNSGLHAKLLEKKLTAIIVGWQNYFSLQGTGNDLRQEVDRIIQSSGASLPARLMKAGICLRDGNREEAAGIIHKTMELPVENGDISCQRGIICEVLGMEADAREDYIRTLRVNPGHGEAIMHLGLNYLKEGLTEKAIRFLQKAVNVLPDSADAWWALGTALEAWSLPGAAKKAFHRATSLDPKISLTRSGAENIAISQCQEQEYSTNVLDRFLELFTGREGIHAVQWLDASGRSGYRPVMKPCNRQDVINHLAGKQTLGLYLMRADNTVKTAVIDIDAAKEKITSSRAENREEEPMHFDLVLKDANNIMAIFREVGIAAYLELSGWKGVHCWIFLDQPVRAAEIRHFMGEILRRAGPCPPGIHREIFPKQDKVAPDAMGCLIKLPLGEHLLTQKRCSFIDQQGNPCPDQLEYLQKIRTVSRDAIIAAASTLKQGLSQTYAEGGAEISATVDKVLKKCKVLSYLAAKAEKERHLTHSERLAILHTLGHLGDEGKKAIHAIIGRCLNYRYNYTEKWTKRVQKYPLSCPKIRNWLSNITPALGCYCHFSPDTGYPSPVLHAGIATPAKSTRECTETVAGDKSQDHAIASLSLPAAVPHEALRPAAPDHEISAIDPTILDSVPVADPISDSTDDADTLVRQYVFLKRAKEKLDKNLLDVEDRLEGVWQGAGNNEVQLSMGRLKKTTDGGKVSWLIEL